MLTAWNTHAVGDLADPGVPQFIDRDKPGLGTPERGATCSGGDGGTG
ncbi:hypothetical protein Dcar01_01032 [Deinococcus carri]|uniref:Uncharacterized protein n=1 Tax=Deinococcus carri TaxID=1211323 RepID=A0ABP9W8I7_9DEIO